MKHLALSTLLGLLMPALYSTPALAGEVELYSLTDNRVAAHMDQGGLLIDGGSPGFVRYVNGNFGSNWKVARPLDGKKVTLVPGRQGTIRFPLSARQAGARRLEIHMKGLVPKQRVTVFLNKKSLGDLEVSGDWSTGSKEIPAGLLKAGENRLRLTFRRSKKQLGTRTAAALRWIRLALPDAAALPGAGPSLSTGGGSSVSLSGGGGLSWYLMPPARAALKFSAPAAAGCTLQVVSTPAGGSASTLATQTLEGGVTDLAVPLKASGNTPLRLDLLATGAGCGGVRLQRPRLVGPGTAPASPRGLKPPRQVIFWMVDTLRADRLDVYRKSRVATPNLDRLVAEGTTFRRYSVEGNESKVSHASFFTGTYPMVHRVLGEKAKLPSRLVTIAEAMRSARLRTAGLISNGYVSDAWNYHQGFQTYENYIRSNRANDARAVYGHAAKWLDCYAPKGPFYLYLGTIDPHVTYRAHKDILPQYDSKPYNGPFKRFLSGVELGKVKEGKLRVSSRDKRRIEALYDNEVTYNDRYFGRLLEYLQTKGMLDETLIVVTGDHGDEFWEHGGCGHGSGVYEELIGTPLVFRYPPAFPKGKVVEVEADGVDLLPTLTEALGKPAPEAVQGESLLPWIAASGSIYPRTSIATHYNEIYSLRSGDWKLHLHRGGRTKVFDLSSDPTEQTNLKDRRPVARRYLADALALFLAHQKRWKKATWGVPTNLRPGFGKAVSVP